MIIEKYKKKKKRRGWKIIDFWGKHFVVVTVPVSKFFFFVHLLRCNICNEGGSAFWCGMFLLVGIKKKKEEGFLLGGVCWSLYLVTVTQLVPWVWECWWKGLSAINFVDFFFFFFLWKRTKKKKKNGIKKNKSNNNIQLWCLIYNNIIIYRYIYRGGCV